KREFPRDLEPLGLTPRQRRRGLAEPQVAEPHLLQMPEGACQASLAVEPLERLVHGPFEHVVNGAPPELDLEYVLLEALPPAGLARHAYVGQKHHLDQDMALRVAGAAPPAGDVEGERAGGVATGAGERLRGEQRAQ